MREILIAIALLGRFARPEVFGIGVNPRLRQANRLSKTHQVIRLSPAIFEFDRPVADPFPGYRRMR